MRTSYLPEQQMLLILAALTPGNRLVCRVMLHTGLRVGDAVALRRDQVARGRFTVTEAKTGKRRRIGLPTGLVAEILAAGDAKSPWAFPSPRNPEKHRTRQAVWKDIKRAQRAFRIPLNAGPHSLRKVYAVELMRKYGDLHKVQRALLHSNDMTTLLYALADRLPDPKNLLK